MTISRESDEIVELFSNQTLVCNAYIATEVDVPIAVEIEWSIPHYFNYMGKHNISEISHNGSSYTSVMTISNFNLRASGEYSCTASVRPVDSSSEGVHHTTVSTTSEIFIRTHGKNPSTTDINKNFVTLGLHVSIQVDYTPPSDFHLPSPPYYRPASSVSLTCVVPDEIGGVSYLWFSTNTDSFVNGSTERMVHQNILTAFDAGYHTCTVTDYMGNTGSAHTKMKLIGKKFKAIVHYSLVLLTGAGIYASRSNSALHNNTALSMSYHKLYCLSNSTTTEYRPSIGYPSGRIYPNATENDITVSEYRSGILFYRYLYEEGIYICNIADSNSHVVQLSIGFYNNNMSKLLKFVN